MKKQDYISSIRQAYPNGFKQEPRDNYERTRKTPDGKECQQYNLKAVSIYHGNDAINMFSSFQGGDNIEKFVVDVKLREIEKGNWQKVFYTFDEAMQLYTELIGCDAEWHIKVKKTYSLQKEVA